MAPTASGAATAKHHLAERSEVFVRLEVVGGGGGASAAAVLSLMRDAVGAPEPRVDWIVTLVRSMED